MNECLAPAFDLKNLPDPKGIPFQGVEDAKIPGRESVAHLIDKFIKTTRNDKNIQVCLIKAEWGEGKTDAFDRYITKTLESDYCFPVSTSTLSKKLRKIEKETYQSNTATNFLTALFTAIGDDQYSQTGEKGLFYEGGYVSDPIKYLDKTSSSLFEGNDKNLYLFLDEFEEILYNDDVKVDVISGIKEIINKKYRTLCEGGKYEGRFHLFIACTPHAWNTITEDPNFSQVIGSTEQRLAYNLIELPLLSKSDCYHFLSELTKVTYNGKLSKLPISSSGIFETIINISQRNPRALIQLFYQLMSNIQFQDKDTIKCIDSAQIFRDLTGVKVSVYGSTTPAIEFETVDSLKISLSNSKSYPNRILSIFELLTGESKSFTASEISERLKIPLKDIPNLINQINEIIRKDNNLDSTIETYYKLKEDKNFDSLMSYFIPIDKNKDQYITIDSEMVYVSNLKEVLENYVIVNDFSSGVYFQKQILIPTNSNELSKLIGLSSLSTERFFQLVKNNFDSSTRYYRISNTLIENIFPSPNLAKFDFIEDRNKRLDLRRKIQKDMGDLQKREILHEELTKAIVRVFDYTNIKCIPNENYFILELILDTQKIQIPVIIEAILETITQTKINELIDLVYDTPAVLTLLFYQSHLDKSILEVLESIGEIQRIPMEKLTVEQLLVWRKAKQEGIKINPISERSRISSIIKDLKFEYYLNDVWISKAKSSGIIIPSLKELGDYGKSDIKPIIASFVSASNHSLDDQWRFYEKLKSLKLFNAQASFAPSDVETKDQWKAWAYGLSANQFISSPNTSHILSTFTPVEKRILQMIQKNHSSSTLLEREFVNLSEAKNALKNYYLDTLIQKGKIRKKIDEYFIIPTNDSEFASKIKMIQEFVNVTFQQNRANNTFISQTKQREAKVIDELEYILTLRDLLSKISDSQEDEILRISKLIIEIYEYYNDNIRPMIVKAQNNKANLFSNTKRKFDDLKLQVNRIVTVFNKLTSDVTQHITSDSLLKDIEKKFSETVINEYNKIYDKETTLKHTKNIWQKFSKSDYKKAPFHFEKSDDDAYFFNLHYYFLKEAIDKFELELNSLKGIVERTNQYVQKIDDAYRGIDSTSASFVFDSEHKVSNYLLNLTSKINPPEPLKTTQIAKLNQIEEHLTRVSETVGSFNKNMNQILTNLTDVDKHESNLLKLRQNCQTRIKNLNTFLENSENIEVANTSQIKDKVNDIHKQLLTVNEEYELLTSAISTPIRELPEFVKRVTQTNYAMEQLSAKINQIEKTSNDIIDSFILYIDSETQTLINFVNICSKSLPSNKKDLLVSLRMDFQKFTTKLKDRIRGF